MKDKGYLFDEFEEKKLECKLDPSGDLFQRHPFFYFFLCVYLLLGIVAFSIFICNAMAIIEAFSRFL